MQTHSLVRPKKRHYFETYNISKTVPLGVVVPDIILSYSPSLTHTISAAFEAMTIDTVELRKIQYAQELAAYTMRQWMLMRDDGSAPSSTGGPTASTQNSATSAGRQTRDDVNTVQRAPSHAKT